MKPEGNPLINFLKKINKLGTQLEQKKFENDSRKQIEKDKDNARDKNSNTAI